MPRDTKKVLYSMLECECETVFMCICLSLYLCVCVYVCVCICVCVFACGWRAYGICVNNVHRSRRNKDHSSAEAHKLPSQHLQYLEKVLTTHVRPPATMPEK